MLVISLLMNKLLSVIYKLFKNNTEESNVYYYKELQSYIKASYIKYQIEK